METSEHIVPKGHKFSNCAEIQEQISICKFAFHIHHILDTILSYCEKPLLLECRTVSSFWSKASTFQLQKITTFLFVDYALLKTRKPLEELTKLCHNFQPLDLSRNVFFCTHFRFEFGTRTCCDVNTNAQDRSKLISNISLQNFLSACGAHVQNLTLNFKQLCNAHVPTEKVIMDEIEKLLTVDLPNLKEFTLGIGSEEQGPNIIGSFPLSLTRVQLAEIYFRENGLKTSRNRNLRWVYFKGKVSAKLVEMVQMLAPNLREIELQPDKIVCLLEPLNRINFLKCMDYFLDKADTYYLFEKFAQRCSGQFLKLRELRFCLESRVPSDENFDLTPRMQNRISNIMNTILNCSWDSLELILWSGVITSRGLNWPSLMPRVRRFLFSKIYTHIEKNIFPRKFSWCKTFPCLRQVVITNCVEDRAPQDLFKALNLEPMKSVISIKTQWYLNDAIETELKDIFGTYFPNAEIYLDDRSNWRL